MIVRAPLLALLVTTGCTGGLGLLQTAQTLPPGQVRHNLSIGYDHNEMVDSRGASLGNVTLQYSLRFGVTERVDMGVKTFLGAGVLVDSKVRLVERRRLAVSVLGGLGGAVDLSSEAKVLHVPALMLASYRLTDWFSPYIAAGYGAFWIFGYGDPLPPGTSLASRSWHGDGLLMMHIGTELATAGTALLLEYGYLQPIVEDPGDRYEFATNHLFLVGFRH